jgi:hypothetical protein
MVKVGNQMPVQKPASKGIGGLKGAIIKLTTLALLQTGAVAVKAEDNSDLAAAKENKADIEKLEIGRIYVDKERLIRRNSNDELVEYIPTNNSKIFFANEGENAYFAYMNDEKGVHTMYIKSSIEEIGFGSDEPIDHNKVRIFTLKEDKYYVAQFEGKKGNGCI